MFGSGLWAPLIPLLVGAVLLVTGERVWGVSLMAAGFLGLIAIGFYWNRKLEEAMASATFDAQVIVTLPVSSESGTDDELDSYRRLAEELERRVVERGAGEYDGDGAGEGSYDMYFAGQDNQRLAQILRASLKAKGIKARVEVVEG